MRKKYVPDLCAFSKNELCEIHHSLNRWEWDDRLGEKPPNWDRLPRYRAFGFDRLFGSKQWYIEPIARRIESLVGCKALMKHYLICYKHLTEEEFEEWYDVVVSNAFFSQRRTL